MSNGQPDQNKGLIPFLRPDVVVNADEYASNLNKIAKIRQLAATMEQTNQQAHQRYIQQELQRRVEEGERAQQMLANMSQASNNQTIIPPNPATFFAPAASHLGHQDEQSAPQYIPTTARIEEIPSSASSRISQQVDGRSTIPVSSAGLNGQSQQPTTRQSYGGQTYNTVNQSNGPRFGGTTQGRWQTIQPRQQQQPQPQRQPQQLSQQQISRQQQQLLLQHQRQQQQRYAHPQITQYEVSMPGQFPQPQILGHTHPGHGSNHPQSVTIPAANTSSLEGALGVPGSRATSSSSHRATPAPTGQPDPPVNQSGTQEQHAGTQRRQSMDKDMIAANVIQRMGPNYISNMVAEAQANPSTTLPKPPTRENRAAAASQAVSSSTTSEPQKAEALINLEPPVPVSPAQVRSNTRHIATQRPSNVPVVPAPTSAASAASTLPLSTPTSSNTHQAASAHQPIVSNGPIPSNVSTAPPSAYTRPSASSSSPYPSISQNVAPVQPQFVTSMHQPHVQGGRQWLSYVPPGQPALQSGFQPGLTRPWITPKIAPAISHAVMDPDAPKIAAVPTTPTNQQAQQSQMGFSPRTPASADKRHLARDILRSLRGSHLLSGKRKRSEEPPTDAKRVRPSQDVQPSSDALVSDSTSNVQSNSALSNQQIAVDALPVHASALQREEEEGEEEEIMLVEDMMSLSPLAGPQLPQTAVKSSSPPLQLDEIIDISDDELQNEKSPAKPIEALPITASISSPFPSAQLISSKAKEPLFLPSPSSSPRSAQSLHDPDKDTLISGGDVVEVEAPWDMPSMDVGDVSMEQLRPPGLKQKEKKMKVYVLIPPPPDWVKRAKQRGNNVPSRRGKNKGQKSNRARRIPWLPDDKDIGDSENGIEEIEGSDNEGRTSQATSEVDTREAEERRQQAVAAEREAMSLTSSVLRKQPCKWRYCDVVMNTVDKLSQHVIQHVRNKPDPYTCLWKNCVRRFSEESKLLAHLDSHVRSPVPCPYQDCDLAYRTPKDLVAHCRIEHGDDQRRTSPKPFKPTLMSLPAVPARLPSYMVVPRDVRQTPISKDRHALLGPWVLRNIFGPVNLEGKRQNAAVPLRSARGVMDKEDSSSQFIASDEYDFLRPKSPSSTPKVRLDDIPSAAVSRLVHAGLVFWGPKTNSKESDPMDIDQALNKINHGDEEDKDPQPKTEKVGLLSVSDGESEDRHGAMGGAGPHSNPETQAETACVVF